VSVNPDPHRDAFLEAAARDLAGEFVGVFDPETVRHHVYLALEMLGTPVGATFRDAFARRFARDLLRSAARWKGAAPMTTPLVLFVCVHNAGRSQMAAAFAEQLGRGRIEVLSAGSAPSGSIHPNVHAVMKEVGIDLSAAYPKRLSEDFVRAADVVVTMGCGDACPVFVGKRYEDWEIADPKGQPLDRVRAIRDAIRARVEALLASLGVATTEPGSE